MAGASKKKTAAFRWTIPASSESISAFEYFRERPPEPSKLTLPFELHKPSRWKLDRCLVASDHKALLLERILAEWKEDPKSPREDGALALVLGMQENTKYKARTLS